jgi:hypothetical protein
VVQKEFVMRKMKYQERYKNGSKHVKEIAAAFDAGDYFKVLVLAPQVFEIMINELEKDYSEDMASKIGKIEDPEILKIYSMHNRLQQTETIKARVAGKLLWFFESEYWENLEPPKNSGKEFKKYFTKIESIFAIRNGISHEYFKKKINNSNLERNAKACFEIVDLLNEGYYLF